VAGRLHVEPLEWIGLFARAGLVEIVSGVGKLGGEYGDEAGGDFVAAGADRGADCGQEIGGLAAEFELHSAHGFLSDAGKSSAPARMNGGNRALFWIDKEYRHAVGGLDGEEHAGAVCGGGITFADAGGSLRESANHVRMDLL